MRPTVFFVFFIITISNALCKPFIYAAFRVFGAVFDDSKIAASSTKHALVHSKIATINNLLPTLTPKLRYL